MLPCAQVIRSRSCRRFQAHENDEPRACGMNLPRPLRLCAVTGLPDISAPSFRPCVSALRHQSTALGIPLTNAGMQETPGQRLSFALQVPDTSPIVCAIGGWPDDAAAATEFTIQAACGLMSVHGRASGRVQALGVNYVSTLALQGALAAAVGQRRGRPGASQARWRQQPCSPSGSILPLRRQV